MDPDFRLTQAVLDNKINEVKKLLKDKSVDINEQDIENNTPLMYACEEGKKDIVKLLVEAGADLNMQNSYGETALRKVDSPDSISIAKDITRYLIKHGANPYLKEDSGMNALVDSTTKEIYVKYLIDKVKKKLSFSKIMMNDKDIPDDIIRKILKRLDNKFVEDKKLLDEITEKLKKSNSKKTGSKKTKKNKKKKSKKKPNKSTEKPKKTRKIKKKI